MAQQDSTKDARPIFVFDTMRARSHLFFRYLSTSPELKAIYHPVLMAAFLGPQRWAQYSRNSPARTKEMMVDMVPLVGEDTYESVGEKFLRDVEGAEREGKIPLSNEHIFNVLKQPIVHGLNRDPTFDPSTHGPNPTYIPDSIFNTLRPVILTRHPVTQINSAYRTVIELGMQIRTGDEDLECLVSQKYFRYIFDLFTSQNRQPLVVDSDDLLWRTDAISAKLCTALNLDPTGLSQTWSPTPENERPTHPILAPFTVTIHASKGIERPETHDDTDLDRAYEKWVEMHGEESAGVLRELVRRNMEDYEYLCRFKV